MTARAFAFASTLLTRLVAIGVLWFALMCFVAALGTDRAAGYALFALAFAGIAVGLWRESGR